MITTTTETDLTCDKCGRTIVAGEKWYQLTQIAAVSTFDGKQIRDLVPVAEISAQLCEQDYQLAAGAVAAAAPLAAAALELG